MTETARYGQRKVSKMLAEVNRHRAAVRAGDPDATEQTWENLEQWLDLNMLSLLATAKEYPAMKKLFAALRAKHPDHEVVDVQFTVAPREAADQSVADLDAALADAARDAEPVDIAAMFGETK